MSGGLFVSSVIITCSLESQPLEARHLVPNEVAMLLRCMADLCCHRGGGWWPIAMRLVESARMLQGSVFGLAVLVSFAVCHILLAPLVA